MMKVTNDFYKQFEELSIKLDKLLKENKNMISQISTMKQVFQWVLQKIQVLKVMLI